MGKNLKEYLDPYYQVMRPVDRSKPISYDVPLQTGRKKITGKMLEIMS